MTDNNGDGINQDIFKAYDIRGKVGEELTPDVARRIGQAFAEWLEVDGPVAVGYDMRPDSEELSAAFMEGLTMQGRDVWNIGRVASDMIYFVVGKFGLAGGAVVTASHNPGEYNGIKLCREQAGAVGLDTGLADIRDFATANNFDPVEAQGKIHTKDVMDDWVEHALGFIDRENLKPYKIAIDAGNGMAGHVKPHVTKHLPFDVHEMYYDLDGTFPNHEANPLKVETLQDLQERIREHELDFGIAFDGDGDRAVLVDEKGDPLSGSVLSAILARYFLEKNPGATVLYNAICSNIVPETIEKHGGTPVRTRVGHSIIKNNMREHDAVFAGEHSGHYYFDDNWKADSGLIAAMAAIDVLNKSGGTLSELADEFRVYHNIVETNFEVEDKQAVLEHVAAHYEKHHADVDWLDGITVRFGNGDWFNLRPSNTEPLLRMNAEASKPEALDQLVDEVKSVAGL